MSTPDELRELVESYLAELALTPELKGLEESMRHALAGGGKRVRPVLCLATAEAAGAEAEAALPAAAALELVHNFSLVHDDLPALDDDELRRGRPSTWAQFGEAVAILAGDALFGEALRLALSYPSPAVARELVQATLGMAGAIIAEASLSFLGLGVLGYVLVVGARGRAGSSWKWSTRRRRASRPGPSRRSCTSCRPRSSTSPCGWRSTTARPRRGPSSSSRRCGGPGARSRPHRQSASRSRARRRQSG